MRRDRRAHSSTGAATLVGRRRPSRGISFPFVGMHWLMFSVLPLLLFACGSEQNTTSGVTPTRMPAKAASSPVVSPAATPITLPTPNPVTPAPPGRSTTATNAGVPSCGIVRMRDNIVLNGDEAGAAEVCFWQAYQACISGATVSYVKQTGPDTSVDGTLGLQSMGNTCRINYSGGSVIIISRNKDGTPEGSGGAPAVGICTAVFQDPNGGLTFQGCPVGDVSLPVPP